MAAAISIAVLGSLAFIAWMIFRAIKDKTLTAHVVSYGIAIVAAVFTYGYFLSLNLDALVKIVVSIVVGVALIFIAASRQRRARQA